MLKLRLQRTDSGRGLGLAVWRQTEGAGVRYAPRDVRGKEPTSTIKAPPLTCTHKGRAEPTAEASLLVCSQGAWPCEFWTSAPAAAGCPQVEARLESKPAPEAMQLRTQAEPGCAVAVGSVDSSAAGSFLNSAPSGVRADNRCGCRFVVSAQSEAQPASGLTHSFHGESRCATTAVLAPDLCLRTCTGSFVRTVPEGHLGQPPEFPRLRPGRAQC